MKKGESRNTHTVASLLLDGHINTLGVGNSEIISDNLNIGAGGQFGVRVKVILVKGILNRHDWGIKELDKHTHTRILFDKAAVEVGKLGAREPGLWLAVGILEIKIILALLVKLGSGNVHANLDLVSVPGRSNSRDQKIQALTVVLDVWGKSAFVTDVCSILEASRGKDENARDLLA